MDVIHFTRGATDPLDSDDAHGVHFLPLADGAVILLAVESHTLKAHARGISSPERIAGQTWPSDLLPADHKAQS